MVNPTEHHFSQYSRQTLYWLPPDTQELYNLNLKNHKDQLEKYNWIDQPITYSFNSHGFRSEEFTNDPTVLFLGCSLTMGIGLPVENTWCHHVANQLNLHNANLGLGGSSNDTAFRLALHWLDKINPKIVILYSPSTTRFELLGAHQYYDYLPGHTAMPAQEYYKLWSLHSANGELSQIKNQLAIQQLCTSLNIKFLSFDVEKYSQSNLVDLARDLMHPGLESNKAIADVALSLL